MHHWNCITHMCFPNVFRELKFLTENEEEQEKRKFKQGNKNKNVLEQSILCTLEVIDSIVRGGNV